MVPGAFYQAHAFDVDRLLLSSDLQVPPMSTPRNLTRKRNSPTSIVSHHQVLVNHLKTRTSLEMQKTFEWDERIPLYATHSPVERRDWIKLVNGESSTVSQSCNAECSIPKLCNARGASDIECHVTEAEGVKCDALGASDVGCNALDTSDVEFSTQMAAEVIESLSHAPVASFTDCSLDFQPSVVNSSEESRKENEKSSFSDGSFCNSRVTGCSKVEKFYVRNGGSHSSRNSSAPVHGLTPTAKSGKIMSRSNKMNRLNQDIAYASSTSSSSLGIWVHSTGKRTHRKAATCYKNGNHYDISTNEEDCVRTHNQTKDKSTPKEHNQTKDKSTPMELAQHAVSSSNQDSMSTHFRSRRALAHTHVLLSQHLDGNIIKQQKKIMARLGIPIAKSSTEATHFVADRFTRTKNMLEAIALGKPVVTHLWLEGCLQASFVVDERKYLLRDEKKEKEIGFSLSSSLACAVQQPLLKGKKVLVTSNIKPDKEMITGLVRTVCGEVVDGIQGSIKIPDELLILSCEEDHEICQLYIDKGATVYSSELLLNGIIAQRLDYDRYRLFPPQIVKGHSTKKAKR